MLEPRENLARPQLTRLLRSLPILLLKRNASFISLWQALHRNSTCWTISQSLRQLNGERIPEEIVKGERFAFIKGSPKLLGSPHNFRRYGQSGTEVSNLMPNLSTIVDDIAVIRSMHTDQFNHAPAQIFMNTGSQIIGRPSMGSWLTYGIGSENSDLPGFVVLLSGENNPDGGKSCWSSGFLPTTYQGVEFRSKGDPVLFLSNPEGMTPQDRRRSLDALRRLNEIHLNEIGDPEINTRIASYEMSYRMQTSVPELTDIAGEPRHVHEMYGTEQGGHRSRIIACWRGVLLNVAFALFSSIIAAGITRRDSK